MKSSAVVTILIAAAASATAQPEVLGCDESAASSLERNARDAESNRAYDDAVAHLRVARSVCPLRRAYLLDISRLSVLRRDYVAAIESAKEFLAADSASVPGRIALAYALFMSQKFAEARDIAAEVLRTAPGDAGALRIKGNCQYLLGDVVGATKTFIALLEKHPSDETAPYMLGRIYYQEGMIDQAMGQFERALRLNPKSYKALEHLGLCYQAQGDDGRALRYLLAAIASAEKQDPRYDVAYADLADLLLRGGDAQKAYDAAAKAADRNPLSARNFFLGGKALNELGKVDLAVNWLQRSTALDGKYAEPWYLLARIYRKRGEEQKSAEALATFRKLSANAPGRRR